MRLSDRLQGLCAQSWAKTGLGKKPYNTKKYGIQSMAKGGWAELGASQCLVSESITVITE